MISSGDDLLIVEPVDRERRPVPVAVRSARVLLTSLYNPALPLIRYELTDEITMLDERCPCGSQHRLVADPLGRLDDSFTYGPGVVVHPHLFRSALGCQAGIVEYQVRQTAGGAAISVRGHPDVDRLEHELAAGLERLGLEDPEVTITTVTKIERQDTGKLRRFVPR
ncbi:MAG TPA: hypothetical protein VHF45_03350 [Thermoleophilaceae bacterium]|nr:hypothetical protein [Thermoleophilaceae bacterium]